MSSTRWAVHIQPGLVDGVGGARVSDRVAGVRRLPNLHAAVG